MFKIDFEKAYDRVNWNCLFKVLHLMGFSDKWISWVRFCVQTAGFSVLINGTPCGYFGSSRGLRQGDPLSPLLFVLLGQVLSGMWKRDAAAQLIEGVNVGRAVVEVTHLQYADDTVLFSSVREDRLKPKDFA